MRFLGALTALFFFSNGLTLAQAEAKQNGLLEQNSQLNHAPKSMHLHKRFADKSSHRSITPHHHAVNKHQYTDKKHGDKDKDKDKDKSDDKKDNPSNAQGANGNPLHNHGHVKSRFKGMYGSQFATYIATVEIENKLFDCVMDTGSSDFAVLAYEQDNCHTFYDKKCTGPELLSVYGEGNWTGHGCKDDVTLGEVVLKDVVFGAMEEEHDMVDCVNGHAQNGIIGMAYKSIMSFPPNTTEPLFESLFRTLNIPRVFSMQCCGWAKPKSLPTVSPSKLHPNIDSSDREMGDHGEEATEKNLKMGDGTVYAAGEMAYNTTDFVQGSIDVGGVRRDHYSGHLWWTPISVEYWFNVEMLDLKIEGESVFPVYRSPRHPDRQRIVHTALELAPSLTLSASLTNAAQTDIHPLPMTIVDSGTSNVVLTEDLFDKVIEKFKTIHPEFNDDVWAGTQCIPHSNDLGSLWPDIVLTFAGENGRGPFDVIIPWCRYLVSAPSSECKGMIDGHMFSIESGDMTSGNILGQVFMEEYYIVHDLDRRLLGIGALDGCPFTHECRAKPIKRWQTQALPLAQTHLNQLFDNYNYALFQNGAVSTFVALLVLTLILSVVVMSRVFKRRLEYDSIDELP